MAEPRQLRILMVEDSEDDALLVARELRRAGYEPAITRIDNASALQHELHTGQWDVLLSDYFVPGLPIETALRIAREYAPELPFIIVFGAIGEERAVSVMRLGAQDFIMKGRLARLAPAIERELLESENRQQRRLAEVEIAGLNRTLGRRLQELEKVLEVVPVGICMADDPACTDIRINPAMARILHVRLASGPLQSAPQASASEMQLFPRSSPAGAQQSPMLAAVRTGEPQENIELNIRRQDGVVVHLFGSAAPLLDEASHVRGCVAAYVDMSDRRAAEAALRNAEKLATVGRLAATIAHEINNPLEAVTNVLYLISRSPKLDAALRQYVTIAQAELDRIGTIVRHTLGFHREASTPVSVSIADLIDETLHLYERRITTTGIQIEKRYESHGAVVAFPGEMRQVFSNLLVNAIEAVGRNGRIVVHVTNSRANVDRRRRGVRVVVADNGSGIPPDIRQRIFDPFFTTKGEKGSGLGLWVSEGIIRKHGGSIRLRSRYATQNTGTVISVFIPKRPIEIVEERATA